MNPRKIHILKSIIETFIETGGPVGSQFLLDSGEFNVSSATIRNDMADLEEIGLIYQPHTSSGRIPTGKGFRMFVDQLMDNFADQVLEKKLAQADLDRLQTQELEIRLHNAVSILARLSNCLSFATLPWKNEAYYLGIANVLKRPEFQDTLMASTVIEMLEDKDQFLELLAGLQIDHQVRAYIGEENAIPGIQSCTLLVTLYKIGSYVGAIGILGPVRMRYAYNMQILDAIRGDVEKVR